MKVFDEILEIIESNGISLAKVSKDSGVPYDRMAQWKGGKGNPKAEDEKKLQEWLRNFKVIYVKESPISKTDSNLDSLIRQNENLTKANMDLSANLLVLTRMLESKKDSDLKSLVAVETMKHNLLELLSILHTKGVKYQSSAEAISKLNTLFAEIESR